MSAMDILLPWTLVAVLGEMGELGEDSERAHAALAEELARYRVTNLVTVGFNPATEALARAARDQGVQTLEAADATDAAAKVEQLLAAPPAGVEGWRERRDRDVVLVKASNALGLWAVAERLLRPHTLGSAEEK